MVRVIDTLAIWDYWVEIEDVSGEPVPLTELAKKMAGKNPDMMPLPASMHDRVPAEDWKGLLDVSKLYQIKRAWLQGHAPPLERAVGERRQR
jgi:hypothetical protein